MIRAIIFDFDGVIVESMDIKTKAFAFLFKDYPSDLDEILRFHSLHGGLSRFEKFDYIYREILGEVLSPQVKERLGEEFSQYVYEEVIKCPFVQGAREFLDAYYKRISLFIVSGTPQDELVSIIKARGIDKYFVEVFGTPGRKKDYNIKILKQFSIGADETIVVGDSIDDYNGAKEAGLKFVGRVNGINPFKDLKIEGSIDNLFDLEKLINEYQI